MRHIPYSISNTKKDGPVVNQIAAALVERIVQAAQAGTKFKVINTPSQPQMYSGSLTFMTCNVWFVLGCRHHPRAARLLWRREGRNGVEDDHGGPVQDHQPWREQYL